MVISEKTNQVNYRIRQILDLKLCVCSTSGSEYFRSALIMLMIAPGTVTSTWFQFQHLREG